MVNDERVHKISSQGFSLQVDAYEQGRPGYPLEAVQYALKELHLNEGHKKVLDLAAGTGKLTRMLAQQPNLEIVAVEPNEAMVGKFKALQPHIEIHQAAAQDLPFEDNSLDAVCAAQAFHWFANEDSLREIHRVLKPTGGFIMFANREDDRDSWARAILCSFEPYSKGIPQYWTGDWVNVWRGDYAAQHYDVPRDDPRSRSVFFEHSVTVTRQQAWARIVSRSYLAVLPQEELAEVKATFESVLEANKNKFHTPPGAASSDADSEVAAIPLRLEVFIARKR
ncbi:g3922 [Coccomyxa viridis]|uniref:G3922 protein n=1 Tax=Coccomyxa viridis TaxID=1274662 RepID=A0ABP1FNZ6_9CHLO